MKWRTQARFAAAFTGAMVMFVGAMLTNLSAEQARLEAIQKSTASFDKVAMQLEEAIRRRITTPRYGLGGFRSTLAALGHAPSAAEFRQAVAARNLPFEFPGVLGFGFIQPVSDADLPAFFAKASAEYGGEFRLNLGDSKGIHYLIRSVEPLDVNRAALGYDVGSNPVRRAAVEQALRTGALAVTGPIHLLQAGEQQWGSLYIIPAFAAPSGGNRDATSPMPSPPQRMLGLVYAAVSYPAALADLDVGSGLASFSLYDTSGAMPVELFDSDHATAEHPLFRTETRFELGGQEFAVRAESLPAFEEASQATNLPRLIRIGGAIATLLAALLIAELILRKFRAADLARKMVEDIDRLATVGRLTHNAIAITDNRGDILWVNPAFVQLYGRDEDDLVGMPLADLVQLRDSASTSGALAGLLAARNALHSEAMVRTGDGRELLTEIEIQPYTGRLASTTGLVVIQSDITQRRRDEEILRESLSFLDQTGRAAGVGGWQYDLRTGAVTWSAQTRRIHEVPDDFVPDLRNAVRFYPDEARQQLEQAIEKAIDTGRGWDLELPFVTYRDRLIWVRAMGVVEFEGDHPVRLSGAFQDITRRKQNELALQENRELLRVTLSSIGDAVVTTDAEGNITWLNPVAESMVGIASDEVRGRPVTEVLALLNQDTRHAVDNPINVALRENRTVGLATNTVLISRDGSEYGIEDSAAPIRDDHGRVIGAVMVFHDVTEARALQREVSDRARHDGLTGLLNRHEFEERLNHYTASVSTHWNYGAVFFIDLDHFKIVNDTGGHAAGDQLLCQIASLIQSRVRAQDTVARLGGDEFAVLVENCTMKNAETIAQNICEAVDHYRFVASEGQVFRVGASIGIVSTDWSWNDSDDLMNAADSACRSAKEAGRNRYHVWHKSDEAIQLRAGDSAWGVRVEKALDSDGFELFGQRIVPLKPELEREGALHLEVLLRMKNGDQPSIAPGQFLPAAERFQLINRVDRWVVQRVFEELGACEGCLPTGSTIAINLSGQSVGDPAFHAFVAGLMERAQFDPRILCFEITETAAITNLAKASEFLQTVRKRGVRVALDDFGAGVASFGYLRNLQVDILKIDGQYTQGMSRNPLDMVSMQSFCEVARVLGVKTIAEFVETDVELKAVRRLGIDYAQGYSIHRPQQLDLMLARSADWPPVRELTSVP